MTNTERIAEIREHSKNLGADTQVCWRGKINFLLNQLKDRDQELRAIKMRKNWKQPCTNCGSDDVKPTVGDSGMCGPCFFGEADTLNGNW